MSSTTGRGRGKGPGRGKKGRKKASEATPAGGGGDAHSSIAEGEFSDPGVIDESKPRKTKTPR